MLFLMMFNIALALPPSAIPSAFKGLLKDEGEILKDSFKIESSSLEWTYFSGEVSLSGVLVAGIDYINAKMFYRFFPDLNLEKELYDADAEEGKYIYAPSNGLLLGQILDCDEKGYIHPLAYGILFDIDDKLKLPEIFKKKMFGKLGVRALVTIRDYRHFAKPNELPQSYATLIDFKRLSEIKIEYAKNPKNSDNYDKSNRLYFNSKDTYINLRESPNGKILARILGKAMKCDKEGDKIYPILSRKLGESNEEYEEKIKNSGWIEVFYLPKKALDGRDAVYGFIHSSQLGARCDSIASDLQ